jgi:hypothetical protein
MSPYRNFSGQNMLILDSWSRTACSDHTWELGDPVGFGESGSRKIIRDDGVMGFAKPAFEATNYYPRAAHEKIACDLAHEIGVPVPPVTLWRNPAPKGSAGDLYAISVNAFSQFMNWHQFGPYLTEEFKSAVAPAMAAGFVFHNWIDDTDHHVANGGNVVVDSNCSADNPSIAFIDHAFSLSCRWSAATAQISPIPQYYIDQNKLPVEVLKDVVGKVERVSEQKIREIVTRIPVMYLSELNAELIIRCLLTRQTELARALGVV